MTIITTREELAAVGEGATIRINSGNRGAATWTRRDQQFVKDGFGIPDELLRAALAANAIEMGPIFEVNTIYSSGPYEHYVLRVNDDGSAHVMQVYALIHNEGIACRTERPAGRIVPVADQDDRQKALLQAGIHVLRAQNTAETRTEQMRTLQQEVQTLRNTRAAAASSTLNDFNAALIDVLGNFDDDDDRNRVTNLMSEHGLDMPTRNVSFSIRVTGTREVTLDSDTARALLGGSPDSIDDTSVSIAFTHTIHADDDYSGSDGDPCEDYNFINLEWVRDHLDDEGIAYGDDLDIESRSCSHC